MAIKCTWNHRFLSTPWEPPGLDRLDAPLPVRNHPHTFTPLLADLDAGCALHHSSPPFWAGSHIYVHQCHIEIHTLGSNTHRLYTAVLVAVSPRICPVPYLHLQEYMSSCEKQAWYTEKRYNASQLCDRQALIASMPLSSSCMTPTPWHHSWHGMVSRKIHEWIGWKKHIRTQAGRQVGR